METLEEIIYSLPLEVYREAEKLIVSNSYFFASLKAKIAGDKIELSPRNIKDLSKIVNQKVKSIKVQEDYTDIDTKKISELYTELMNFSHDKNTDDFFKETEKIKLDIQILKEQYLLERKIDLKRAAEPIIKNLERIKSKEEVAEISREINRLFNNKETKVSELERKLLEYNDLQKQEWIKKITNPEDFFIRRRL